MEENLEQAKNLVGDALSEDSAMVYALIAQAEALQRLVVVMERQTEVLERIQKSIYDYGQAQFG